MRPTFRLFVALSRLVLPRCAHGAPPPRQRDRVDPAFFCAARDRGYHRRAVVSHGLATLKHPVFPFATLGAEMFAKQFSDFVI